MAGSSKSVQLRGREAVLQSYRAVDVDVWSIWQANQFMLKGKGEDELAGHLDLLINSGSNAIYTIRVYEDLHDAKEVKSNTADSGSINFKLTEDPEPIGGAYGSGYASPLQRQVNSLQEKMERLIELQLKREEMEEEEEEPEEAPGIMGAVLGLLEDPDKLTKFIEAVRPMFVSGPLPAQVGNVNRLGAGPGNTAAPADPSLSPSSISEEEKFKRIYAAIETLNGVDPGLMDHMEKLATMATANPGHFKSLLSMLDIF